MNESLFDINANSETWFDQLAEPSAWFDEKISEDEVAAGGYGGGPCCGKFGQCLRGKL